MLYGYLYTIKVKVKVMSKVKVKIFSRVSKQNYEKLERIRETYGFKSVYQIVQSLVHTFLNNVESRNPHELTGEEEINQMFEEFVNHEGVQADVRYMKPTRLPHYKCNGSES